MNNKQQNKLNMYVATHAALQKHESKWSSLTGFAEAVDEVDVNLNTITSLAQVQASPNGGAALKKSAKDTLLGTAYQIAAATRAYAVVNKDVELAAQLDYSTSDLGEGRPQEVVARCRNVWSTATDNQAASAAFGVTSRTPGTGAVPRGWGSQTTGTRRGSAASRSRSSGTAVTPRP